MITISPVYIAAKDAIAKITKELASTTNVENLKPHVEEYEDTMNGLSGEIQNLDRVLEKEIQDANAEVLSLATSKGVTITLYQSLIPLEEVSSIETTFQTGKKLYPLTTTVAVQSGGSSTETPVEIPADVVTTPQEETEEVEEIDPIFEEIDADAEIVEEAPLATQQNETVPYLSNSMVQLALTAAANADGLQAGLTTFSHNPLSGLIDNTRELLLYYTADNYANLNVELSGISSDPTLNTEYRALREAIGGVDGLSGCVIQLEIFKEHTERLSGLVLDTDSPNDVTDNDSTSEYLNVNDFSGGPSVIFSFDARYFRSAKYLIQASSANTDRGHQATEIYILHDNHHAYTREITSVYSQEPFVQYSTRLLNSRIEVLANTSADNTDFVISGTRLRIARTSESYGEMSQPKIIQQHEELAVYLNDGVDYVALQSASLTKGYLVANLAREFRDMLNNLTNAGFLIQSTANKQAGILQWANTIKTRRNEIQESITNDYNAFKDCQRKLEALDIAYNLTVAYTDTSGNTIPELTLNNVTKQAILEDLPQPDETE